MSLTHEQALVEFDPGRTTVGDLMHTLTDIGYQLSDPRKVEPFEAQERALAQERNRILGALGLTLTAIGLVANPADGWALALAALVVASLMAFGFAVLRNQGALGAAAGSLALGALGVVSFILRIRGALDSSVPWLAALLAAVMIFGLGAHILRMAVQALRRGIFNQHALVEIGAWVGVAGGMIGFVLQRPDYPTAPFFAVTVVVLTYHVCSECASVLTNASRWTARWLRDTRR